MWKKCTSLKSKVLCVKCNFKIKSPRHYQILKLFIVLSFFPKLFWSLILQFNKQLNAWDIKSINCVKSLISTQLRTFLGCSWKRSRCQHFPLHQPSLELFFCFRHHVSVCRKDTVSVIWTDLKWKLSCSREF